MSELGWPHLLVAFVLGASTATLLLDKLYRMWRREAEGLIAAQRDYIEILEAETRA